MYLDTGFPPGGGRLAQFMRVASDFDQEAGSTAAMLLPPPLAAIMGRRIACRDDVEARPQAAIDALDMLDGDPDVELNGDESDDPGDLCDASYTEWQARGRHRITRAGAEIVSRDQNGLVLGDDEEDDDAKEVAWTEWDGRQFEVAHEAAVGGACGTEDDEEDEHPDAEPDREAGSWPEWSSEDRYGGTYPDDGNEDDCPAMRKAHIARTRERIGRLDRWGASWTLPGSAFVAPPTFRASELPS